MLSDDESPDGLSFSPSLLQILSLVNYEDILNCKCVSRRLHSVIKGNVQRLPQQSIWLEMYTKKRENSDDVAYVHVLVTPGERGHGSFEAYLLDNRIRVVKCELLSLSDRYQTKWMFMGTEQEQVLWQGGAHVTTLIGYGEDYSIHSIDVELEDIMKLLLTEYYISFITIDSERPWKHSNFDTPDELRDILVEAVIRRRLSRKYLDPCCHSIRTKRTWPRLGELCDLIESRGLIVDSLELEKMHSTITRWEKQRLVVLRYAKSRLYILEFVRAWASCQFRIRQINILSRIRGDRVDRMVGLLRSRLQHCEIIVVFPEGELPGEAEIFIRRPDKVVLFISYRNYQLELYDSASQTEPLRFDRRAMEFN